MGYDDWKCTDDSWIDLYEEEIDEEQEARVKAENDCMCSRWKDCLLCSGNGKYEYCKDTMKLVQIA